MQSSCIKCNGRKFCGKSFCPIYAKADNMFKLSRRIKKDFLSSSPAPFIGRHNYPNINVGVLSPPEKEKDAWLYDAPVYWSEKNFTIKDIITLRSSLINSRFKSNVINIKQPNKFLEIAQEIGLAYKPVDIEVELKKEPKVSVRPDSINMPMGPNASLKKVSITTNTKILPKVDKVHYDTDLKSNEGLKILYSKGINENSLSKILSVGALGLKKNRKLVPTRWSITAVDDTLGKELIKQTKQYNEIDYSLYFGDYFGNYYLILFFPYVWSYELFETYMPSSLWNPNQKLGTSTDYENYDGRKRYAENCGGGYYAARISILKKLVQLKRQASILVLRFVTDEYSAPLGVWVCREAVKKTLQSKPIYFETKEQLLKEAKFLILRKFKYNIESLLKESQLLEQLKQTKLINF